MTVEMSEAARILVVEDEPAIRRMLCHTLGREGFDCLEAEDAAGAELAVADHAPDLVLLDWMLPDRSGIELTRRWKRDELTAAMPVILVTARGEEEDKVRGLEVGADDYVTKPFSPRELVARIRAVLRRTVGNGSGGRTLSVRDLVLDPAAHRAPVHGEPLHLGPTEFRLLHFFLSHPEKVYSRSRLIDHVWGRNVYIEERTVDVHIRRLRKALSPHGLDALIQTVRGAGYRFSIEA